MGSNGGPKRLTATKYWQRPIGQSGDRPRAQRPIGGSALALDTVDDSSAEGPDPGRDDRRAVGRRRSRTGPRPPSGGYRTFLGAGVTESILGTRAFTPHRQYVPDIAAGLATLGTDERAVGQVWHLPGPETVTTRDLLDLVASEVNHPVGVRNVPKLAMRALGLVNPSMRELAEMAYEFDEPFVLATSK